jgi:hypothetical protein
VSKNKYCQDCGGALLNPDRCPCGWKTKAIAQETSRNYPGSCMVVDCREDIVVVVWVNDRPVTRCCWHYTQDLHRAGKHQLRAPSA